ncbi:aldehyde dehydrogenase family protein [Streptomyces sp. ME02-8801-2C]|uniref:aldehyde dehydrogenase family protein n=1 Tax=Streptomyces sp. ME02-8801-2C TaxID=3028680 RepID=UPI0029AD1FD5|nr:aldehyde dehydrogenase family protein [Streptomyces sp. ME02-8801-2C]MDX3452049.1 aldehyde dehydrogenase family protein [Streptomyces sp. ME02-8801-2C]
MTPNTHVDIASTADHATETVTRLRATFQTGRTKPLIWRKQQLRALRALLTEHQDAFEEALHTDLGKGATESHVMEIGFLVREIDHTLRHLDRWVRPSRVSVPLSLVPARAWTVREPLGTVLIISPWNYPLNLALAPLIGALAAGNCVVLKPSEVAPATSSVLAHWLPRVLDPQAVAVVEGGVPETTALLEQRFDHIFYTGNGTVGRIVMAAAARHLTPVTLELGGKSPAVVEPGTDLATAARRIAWGKFMNAGQTCVAPDYVLAVGRAGTEIEAHLIEAIREMYGHDPACSDDYGSIVNERHFDRLAGLLADGRTVVGGGHDRPTRYIAPTVLADMDPESPVMREEIFGPILPIVSVPDLDAAISFITGRDKPLALYAFTASNRTKRRLIAETSSGGLTFGVPTAQLAVSGLPFGGVGESGMGRYHGSYSLDTFSHTKSVLDKPLQPDTLRVTYPPYTRRKDRILRRIT